MNESIEKIRERNAALRAEGKPQRYSITTFGCQMNASDSDKIERMMLDMAYEAAGEEPPDVYIYNTCCVRENAENRLYGHLGRLKHLREHGGDFKTVLCGCMMQQDIVVGKIRQSYRNTDVILGTFNLHRLPELLLASYEGGGMVIDIWDKHEEHETELPAERKSSFMASISVMRGCNNFCSYCIVPYVRGRERSRAIGEIAEEAAALAKDGVKEVLLLGQNVNSYALDLGADCGFPDLLREVSGVRGIERIRFMTSHPKDLSDELISEIARNGKVCKHMHLPLQSGSDRILRHMNRRYSRADYLSLVSKLWQAVPGISITTDIIIGFPGETEEDFAETLDMAEVCGFSGAFTFLYSKRPGTPAANMPDQVEPGVAGERFNRLLEVINKSAHAHNEKHVGRELDVLCEDVRDGVVSGRADDNTLVHFAGKAGLIGQIIPVTIKENKTFYVVGEQIIS